MLIAADKFRNIANAIELQLDIFPEHRTYLEKRFSGADEASLRFADHVADWVMRIAGEDIGRIWEDYRWLSEMVLEEELHFRRTGAYRLSTFEEAFAQVYSNRQFMSRYMNGLLASQLWWRNHTEVLRFFRDRFVASNVSGFSHLEIGPGHGLFLHLAASSPGCASAEGWDISDTSLEATRAALNALGGRDDLHLRKADLFAPPKASFSSITFSEVLEHLERPQEALRILHGLLQDGGRIFVNAPVNSPAPDHIYLFEAPEDVVRMVESAGFAIVETLFAPCTGATLDRARRLKLSISTAIIATKQA
jgi:2-polyprenyl-3-methyl-5-hydroxy-6-metoxy-1,4-benzoquinol methylase